MIPSHTYRHLGGRVLWTAAAAREAGALPLFVVEPGVPIISDPDPVPGDFGVDRESDRRTVVHFRYERKNSSAAVMIWCRVGSEWFAVRDKTGFLGIFDGFCTETQVSDNVFDFALIPAGGWWGSVDIHAGDVVEGGVLE